MGDSKGERQIQPVISSLSVLHSLEHTKRFTVLCKKENGKGGEGNGNPLQYSCLENPMDRGGWWAIVQRVTKNRT